MCVDDLMVDQAFIFGKKAANPKEMSVSGFKAKCCLSALKNVHGTLLEIGCGGGQYLRMLLQHRPDLTLYGVDIDPSSVEYAAKIEGLVVNCSSAEELAYAPETFSVVVGFDILEHIEHPDLAVQEVRRVLKKGGIAFFYVPCEGNDDCIYKLLGNHDRKTRQIGHIQQFTADDVVKLFCDAGFCVKKVRYTDYRIGQLFDYLFFWRLEKSLNPKVLWAAQGLELSKGDIYSYILYAIRVIISLITWCEWSMRSAKRGSMGIILTLVKS